MGRIGGFVTRSGLGLVLIYLLTAKVQSLDVVGAHQSSSVFTYLQVGRAGVLLLARSIVTAVVFSMIFLSMIYAEWRAALQLRPDVRAEHDMEMNALRRYAEP